MRKRYFIALFMVLALSISLSGCKKKDKDGETSGNDGTGTVTGGNNDVYPGGVSGLADPDEVYEAGQSIQLDGSAYYISIEDGNDWLDSSMGLGAGEKYISVPILYMDYEERGDKIPEPEHVYLTKATDGNGNTLDIGGPLKPVTDMPESEIDTRAEIYYKEAADYNPNRSGIAMEVWALYKVPEDTRECVIEVFLTDDFSSPHSGAFKIEIEENENWGTFEGKDPKELADMLTTDEKPTLDDFAWFTSAVRNYEEYYSVQYRDADYKADNYIGGWKAYMVHDPDDEKGEFEAHLANITISDFEEEEDDGEQGWFDIRVKWYLGFDAQGNVIDESGKEDLVIERSHFTWNRMNNEEGDGYPDVSFAAMYGGQTEFGRGPMDMDSKFQYTLVVVRPDGTALNADNSPIEYMPGSKMVRVPESMAANMKSSGSAKRDDTDDLSDTDNDSDSDGGQHYGPAAAAREKAEKERGAQEDNEGFADEDDAWTDRGPAKAGRDREKWQNEMKKAQDENDSRNSGSDKKNSSAKKSYVLPDSDTEVLDKSSLKKLSDEDLRLAINEIYARHGRKFKAAELQDYFDDKDWYTPKYEPDEFDKKQNSILNDVEKKNLKTLTEIRSERGN